MIKIPRYHSDVINSFNINTPKNPVKINPLVEVNIVTSNEFPISRACKNNDNIMPLQINIMQKLKIRIRKDSCWQSNGSGKAFFVQVCKTSVIIWESYDNDTFPTREATAPNKPDNTLRQSKDIYLSRIKLHNLRQ